MKFFTLFVVLVYVLCTCSESGAMSLPWSDTQCRAEILRRHGRLECANYLCSGHFPKIEITVERCPGKNYHNHNLETNEVDFVKEDLSKPYPLCCPSLISGSH